MVLVIGGAFSGRHDFAKNLLRKNGFLDFENEICDVKKEDSFEFFLEKDDVFPKTLEKFSSFLVVVATEEGCGVVPLSKEARQEREKNGALNIALAKIAHSVVLVVAGIARVIKGDEKIPIFPKSLAIFRHGQTKSNEEKRFAGGVSDVPLSIQGEKEVFFESKNLPKKISRWNENVKTQILFPKVVFVSPMKRAFQTAEIFFPNAKKIVVEDLREMKLGLFENMTHEELLAGHFADGTIYEKNAKIYQNWLDSGGKIAPPSAPDFPSESLSDFSARTKNALKTAISQLNADFRVCVLVAHGGVQMSLCSQFFFAQKDVSPFLWQTKNASFRFGSILDF